MKIVINNCYGGFSLSIEATRALYKAGCKEIATPVKKYWGSGKNAKAEREDALKIWRKYLKNKKGKNDFYMVIFSDDEKYILNERPENRTDPRLIKIVKKMGEKANGACASLKVVEIPDGTSYDIQDYDGIESIHETHQSWG